MRVSCVSPINPFSIVFVCGSAFDNPKRFSLNCWQYSQKALIPGDKDQ